MTNLQTFIQNYLEYFGTQKYLDKKTLIIKYRSTRCTALYIYVLNGLKTNRF